MTSVKETGYRYSLLRDNFSAYHTKLPVLAPSAAACGVIAQSFCPNLSYQSNNTYYVWWAKSLHPLSVFSY